MWCRNKVHSSWLFEVDVNFLAVIWSDSDLGQMLPGFTWRDLGSRAQKQYDMFVCVGETRLWLSSFRNDAVGIRQSWFTSVNFFFLFRIHLVKVGSSCWSELLCCHWLYNKDRIISFVFSSICRWWLTNLVNWHSGIVFALFALILSSDIEI